MLACDSQRHLSGPQESFARRFRSYPFTSDPRNAHSFHDEADEMFTEDEPKEKVRKLSQSPSSLVHPSPVPPSAMPDGTEVPLHEAEPLPPASASQAPDLMTSSPRASPPHTSRPVTVKTEQASSPVSSAHMMQLLQHQHHQQQQQHQQQEQSHQHPSEDDHHQQQQRHHYNESESDLQQERRVLSDSDSSGPYGAGDGDAESFNDQEGRYGDLTPDLQKDESYWNKRRKNNEAARKSRDKRRMHDMVLEGRITNLESDNGRLRRELLTLKKRFNLPSEATLAVDRDAALESRQQQQQSQARRVKLSPPPPPVSSHQRRNAPSPNMAAKAPHGRSLPHGAYASPPPPPLLAIAGAMQMGMAMYPSAGPGLPYFFPPEASKMSHHEGGALPPHGPGHHGNQHPMMPCHPSFPLDALKQEPYDEDFSRIRERSNSNVERRTSAYPMDAADSLSASRRGSVGNYGQYCPPPVSPPLPSHQSHPASMVSRSKHAPFLPRPYEGSFPQGHWSQRSPGSSQSSDDYDEPLQLTVRRDSTLSTISSTTSNNHYDDNSHESDPGASSGDKQLSSSPPASSFPLKLRHKLPSHDLYSKDMFPSMGTAAIGPNQPSFPAHHPFINGLAHLSDMALSQNNPLSLIKKEPAPGRQRKEASLRHGARRNPLDQKYMDPKYLERRRRNNEAARKCRENRKTLTKIREAKSDYLETENNKLRDELNGLQEEMKQLRELIEKKRMEQGLVDEYPADS